MPETTESGKAEVRPLDKYNEPMEELVKTLETILDKDGMVRSFVEGRGLSEYKDYLSELFDMVKMRFLSGGKKLRSLLTMVSAQGYGRKVDDVVLSSASIIEICHNLTLPPDDYVDNDPMRRLVPSLHIAVRDKLKELGDTSSSYELLRKAGGTVFYLCWLLEDFYVDRLAALSFKRSDKAARTLKDVLKDIRVGQILDLKGVAKPDSLKLLYDQKTAGLFIAAAKVGGYTTGRSEDEIAKLGKVWAPVARAFQYADDDLDYKPGKGTDRQGSDLKNKKFTAITKEYFMMRNSGKISDSDHDEFQRYWGRELSQEEISRAYGFFERLGIISQLKDDMDKEMRKTKRLISELDVTPESRDEMMALANLFVDRQK